MDIPGIFQLLWDSYTTYPALPLLSTGPLIVLFIIAFAIWSVYAVIVVFIAGLQAGPMPWNAPDKSYIDVVPGVMTPEQKAESLRIIERGKQARIKNRETAARHARWIEEARQRNAAKREAEERMKSNG